MWNDKKDNIFTIIFISIIIVFFVIACVIRSKYEYLCIDTQGNEIICEDIKTNKRGGTTIGTKADGTQVYIVEYKAIRKE